MENRKHQWFIYRKKRTRLKACACCGVPYLPSNADQTCGSNALQGNSTKPKSNQALALARN